MKLHDMRKHYQKGVLDEENVPAEPLSLFTLWFNEALEAHSHEANAVILATSDGSQPSARVVLLKEYGVEGFVFYTNYESRKAHDLAINPRAAMLFYWPELERQVRIEGQVQKTSSVSSQAYFDSRPEGSRLSAIVSPQSRVVASRAALEALAEEYIRSGQPLKMPDYWGGFVLVPHRVEFWQGRENRLHDRLVYALIESGRWQLSRLAP